MSVSYFFKKTMTIVIAGAFAVGFSSCGLIPNSPTTKTTDDDIDISPQATGQIVVASFTERDSLDATLATAKSGLDYLSLDSNFSIASASNLGKQALEKIRSNNSTPTVDFSDTASGIARLMYSTQAILVKTYDTVTLRWDDVAKDPDQKDKNIISVSGEKVYLGGKIERLSVVDLDNDGVVAGQPQYNGKARFTFQMLQGAVVENLILEVSAGMDRDFDSDTDNIILALSLERTRNNVTTCKALFEDADNDGALIDKSKSTQSAVDVTLFEKNPPLKPFVDSVTLTIRILTDGKNKANDKIIRLSGKEYRLFGRINTIEVTDIHGNPDVMPNDTAIVTFAGIPDLQNGWRDTVRLVFNVQLGLQNANDNLLFALYIKKEHTIGIVKRVTFNFTTTLPILQGQKPIIGHLDLAVVFGNDKTASIVADFEDGDFKGTWAGPNGNTLTVTWDGSGNVVSEK